MAPQTIPELFFQACERHRKPNAVMVKLGGSYRPFGHLDFRERVCNLGRGLIAMGLQAREHVALLCETRWEWAISDLAIACSGAVNVPVYPTLSPEQIQFILEHADTVGIIVSTRSQALKVDRVRGQLPLLRYLICIEEDGPEGWTSMTDAERLGRASDNEVTFQSRWQNLSRSDLLTIMYTSGTTGDPKGVMLTHGNLISDIESCMAIAPFTPEDTHLSHLPLSHVLERMGGYYLALHAGVTIAYAEDMTTVADNMLEIRPTLMFSVPRLYEKIFAKVHANARSSGLIKRTVFSWAMGIANKAADYLNEDRPMPAFLAKKWQLADQLVFSKVREKTGGNLRFMISGGAPLAVEISKAFLGMGMKIIEGYGLTETSPVLAINLPSHNKPGTVGPPVANAEIRIAPDYEILARGPMVMKGYYKNQEATDAAIINGWFHTGDIGELDEDGFLKITDRKKDLIITSNGKNVAPQPLESALKLSPFIEHAVIIGDKRNFVTALVVPPWETIEDWAPAQNWSTYPNELAYNPEFREFIGQEIHLMLKGVGKFEQVKEFGIIDHPFTVDDGQLTPSLKVKRKVIYERYRVEIDSLYS